MSDRKKTRVHPLSVKLEAIRRVKAGERVSAVAASFAVRRTEVYRWLGQLRDEGGLGHRPRGRPRRGSALRAPGSAAREVELERLVGQQRLELDFFRQALRQVGTVGRSAAGRGASPCSGSSTPGRKARKAD